MVVTDEDEEGRRARASIRSCDQSLGTAMCAAFLRHVRASCCGWSSSLFVVAVVVQSAADEIMPRPSFATKKKPQ